MKAVLDYNAIAVAHGVAENLERPNLTCVKVGNGEIAATDGYVLIRRPLSIKGEGSALIRGEALLRAQKIFEGPMVVLECNGEEATLKEQLPLNPHTNSTITTKPLDATFPTLDDMFPDGKVIAEFAIDPRLLRKVLRGIGDATVIQFRIRKKERAPVDPVEFIAGDTNGLIMPAFCGPSNHWHKDTK